MCSSYRSARCPSASPKPPTPSQSANCSLPIDPDRHGLFVDLVGQGSAPVGAGGEDALDRAEPVVALAGAGRVAAFLDGLDAAQQELTQGDDGLVRRAER